MNNKEFYTNFPYPDVQDTYPLGIQNYRSLSAPTKFRGNILVVGCGTAESAIIANKNPNSVVYGIDVSESSLEISKILANKILINNLILDNKDITQYSETEKFQYVVASCVLHHIEEIDKAIKNIYDSLSYGGIFAGSVYSSSRPTYIRTINNLKFSSVNDLKKYLEENPTEWYQYNQKNHSELADTWLHPYWKEYDKSSLTELLNQFRNLEIYEENYKLFFRCMK